MLHGAFAPPYCLAFPAHRFGSISLCGGSRSSCAHPQNMSLGKNIRSPGSALCHVPYELEDWDGLEDWEVSVCKSADGPCACAIEIMSRTARIQNHFFISPPGLPFRTHSKRFSSRPLTRITPASVMNGAPHCNLPTRGPTRTGTDSSGSCEFQPEAESPSILKRRPEFEHSLPEFISHT